jgi:site-specific recombinase
MTSEPGPTTAAAPRPDAAPATAIRPLVLERLDPAVPPVVRAGLADALAMMIEGDSVPAHIDGFVELTHWLRAEGDPDSDPFARGPDRVTRLVELVARTPRLETGFHRALGAVLAETTGENLFGETGVPHRRGFVGELVERTLAYLLPAPRDDHDLSRLLRRLYRRDRDVESLVQMPARRFARLVSLLFPEDRPDHTAAVAASFADGFRLLAARVVSEGLDEQLRARSPRAPVAESPVLRLLRASDAVLAAWHAGAGFAPAAADWRAARAACRAQMAEVHRRLETGGVSVDIVFGLEVIDRCLSRMSLMVEVMEAPPGEVRSAAVHRLLARLVVAAHEDRSVRHLIGWNLRLLGRKIVDRAGKTGEHYIAYSRREYAYIWRAAAGGGLLTTGTAAVKLAIAGAGLALFQEGLLGGINYAVSFLLLQAFDLILATKQPAMTGATLAAIFRERQGTDRLDDIVDFTARISHSQIAAATANVAVVALGGIVFEAAWRAMTGQPFLAADKALDVQASFNPLASGTIFYAALTGVILWLASLVGGWFDNWSTVHRLPLAIEEHPLGRHLGRARMARLGAAWARQAAGIGTSASLGLMLGLAPVLGSFFGLPIDVRHVTLSAGQLALATAALWPGGLDLALAFAAAGIACMFVLNLSVSFLLAFFNAARAYQLPADEMIELARRLGRRVVTRPAEFVLPARTPHKLPADHVGA